MKKKRFFARLTLVFITVILLTPCLTVFAVDDYGTPKGYVDPVKEFGLTAKCDHTDICAWAFDYGVNRRALSIEEQKALIDDDTKKIYITEFKLVPFMIFSHKLRFATTELRGGKSTQPDLLEGGYIHGVSGDAFTVTNKPSDHIFKYEYAESIPSYNYIKKTYTGEINYETEIQLKNLQYNSEHNQVIYFNTGGYQNIYITTTDEDGKLSESPWNGNDTYIESQENIRKSEHYNPEASLGASYDMSEDGTKIICKFETATKDPKDGTPHFETGLYCYITGVKYRRADGKPVGGGSTVIDTDAENTPGESDYTIPAAIIISIFGAGAAMAAGGASGGSNDSSDKKKIKYKMCLRKDFGDAIRYDTQSVTVYARIVEITPEGEEIDRPDLSARIEMFSSGGLKVESTAMAGNYMGALVCAESAPGGQNPDSGVLSIRFSGEGGSFQNNVTFRLVGKPYISFPERGDYLTMTLPMLLGDGEVYETPVILKDFLEKPTSVRLDVAEGVPLSCKLEEIEEANETRYMLKVKNLSTKPEKPQAVKQMFGIGILAENDKEKAEESVNAELYPEGLSVREVRFDDQGYVVIDTFDNEATDEWGDVAPTGFVLDFVVPEQDDKGRPTARVLEPKEYSPVFAGLKGTDERTTHLAERFKYSIQEIPSNVKEYKFGPEKALVEEKGKPYYLTLPISCTYGQEEYNLELPLRLLGGGPGPLPVGWDEAFSHMKRVVSKVGGISPELAKMLRENGKKMSKKELRLVTYRICEEAKAYYTQDAAEYAKIAAELDNMLFYAEWIKWFGDQAFSFLISKYYGNTADAILSPAKDIFAAFLGEVLDYLLNDEPFTLEELEIIKNITAGVDNLIVNAFDEGLKKSDLKQTCAIVSGFLVWKIAKNIYENIDQDGKVDIYSAITALTADLTAMGVKKIAGVFFEKALDNSAVQKALNKPISKWIQNIAPNVFKGRWDIDKQGEFLFKYVEFKQSDIIQKYLEEFLGKKAVEVVEFGSKSAQDWHKSTEDSNASPVDLSAWPRISWVSEFIDENNIKTPFLITIDLGYEAIGKFFDYLFGELFGDVPFATEAQSPPVDPPYLPEKSLGIH